MHGKNRDTKLYQALQQQLEKFANNPKKAFEQPFYKPTNDGSQGPIVRTIRIMDSGVKGVPVNQGIAHNASMIRVDVFKKSNKYFLVPVYVADLVKGALPNNAITQGIDESEWPIMDETYKFCFSLYPNDLIHIKTKKEDLIGYYKGTHSRTSNITLESHDRSWVNEGMGIKNSLIFEKYQVDPLGNYSLVKGEKRRGMEKHNHKPTGTSNST